MEGCEATGVVVGFGFALALLFVVVFGAFGGGGGTTSSSSSSVFVVSYDDATAARARFFVPLDVTAVNFFVGGFLFATPFPATTARAGADALARGAASARGDTFDKDFDFFSHAGVPVPP